ncbi:MAG: DUF2726 domain-containing protein [Chloroflexi bacterium]|nr:DUF2726 domain-containing protein [Chloroflexota bacterium]
MMIQRMEEAQRLTYRLREPFLTTPEVSLYKALTEMVGDRYVILPKVSLNDLFYIIRPNENVHFFNKIFRKHVDFLLCDPSTFTPQFGVEIVRPMSKHGVREPDKFMDELFSSAGLPLVHIPSSETYAMSDIIALFQLAMTKFGGTLVERSDRRKESVPQCPVCGKMMVLRIYRNGPRSGEEYYGCMDSPRCAGVVAIG